MKLVPAFVLLSSSFFVVWLCCVFLMPAQNVDDGTDSWQLSAAQLPMLRKLHGEATHRPTVRERSKAQQSASPDQCADERGRERTGKFFHVQYFSEHIGFAGDALRSASNLATAMRRTLIAPVVHNAHLSGQKIGPVPYGGQAFCLDDIISTEKLLSDGLTQSKRQAAHCGRELGTCQDGWDALIVFQHRSSTRGRGGVFGEEPLSLVSARKASVINSLAATSAATSNTSAGWWDCSDDFEEFLSEEDGIRMHCQPNKTVFCIDSENQDGLRALDEEVLSNASCVNILSWSVVWNTWLPEFGHGGLLARSSESPGQRTRLGIGRHLQDKAFAFKSANLGMTYVGVHVDLVAMALNGTRSQQAMRPLLDRVATAVQRLLQESGQSGELLLATDVPQWSALASLTTEQRHALQVAQWHRRRVVRTLRPVMLDSVADMSQRYLMEYDLLAAADYLVTVGGTAAQMWIAGEFDRRHPGHIFRSQLRWEFVA